MRLGTLVLCNSHRYPSLTAKMAATLDIISNGRVILGIGAGWNESEHKAYGISWNPSPWSRIEQMMEGVEIIKRMWTEEKPSYEGKYYKIKDAVCNPKPVQKPHPPIFIGGVGEKFMLRIVAKYANGWNTPPLPVEVYARKAEVLRKHCLDVGVRFDSIEKTIEQRVIIRRNREEITNILCKKNVFTPKVDIQSLKKVFLIGTPDECIKRIGEYVDIGVTRFMLWFLDFSSMDGIRIFAKEVMPSFN